MLFKPVVRHIGRLRILAIVVVPSLRLLFAGACFNRSCLTRFVGGLFSLREGNRLKTLWFLKTPGNYLACRLEARFVLKPGALRGDNWEPFKPRGKIET